MDRFDALKTFVAVADNRSFAQAAQTLRISPTAASRAIADLEEALGVTLLRRTTRSVGLTPEGAAYLQPRLLTNSVEAAIDAALGGLGIARALSYQVDAYVRAGRLCYVLPEFDPPVVPVSLLFQASRRGSPNVRALIAAAQ